MWIKIEDEKPKDDELVLLLVKSYDIDELDYAVGSRWVDDEGEWYKIGNDIHSWDYSFNFDIESVVYWMPLPKQPKE